MPPDPLLTAIEEYYSARFAEHGPTAKGVDWNSSESQRLRFDQLAKLFRNGSERFSVNDYGCGYGAFAEYLDRRGFDATYRGFDLSAPMVEHARATFSGRPRIEFVLGDQLERADYTVASGIFNVKLGFAGEDWQAHVDKTVDALATASGLGFAFNMLTSYADEDRKRPDLFYGDPSRFFDRCKRRHSRNVALLHDYDLWEFTIIVRTAS
jgi:SAM-dependent methyltransferase